MDFTHWGDEFFFKLRRFSSTEVPEKLKILKKKTNTIVILHYSEGAGTTSCLHDVRQGAGGKNIKGSGDTHTFTHAVKNQSYKLEWHLNCFFHIEGRGEKKNKIIKHWTLFHGWMDEYKKQKGHMCVIKKNKKQKKKQPITFNKCAGLWRTCIYWLVFQQNVKKKKKKKTHIEISGYMAAGAEVGHRVKKKVKKNKNTDVLKMTRTSECRGNNRSRRVWYDNGCTLYKTRTNSHPGRCNTERGKTKQQLNICGFIYNVHIIWRRRYWQNDILFTCSAMMI